MDTPFDYFFNDRTNPRTIEALNSGPLVSPLEAYAQRLHENGYAAHSGFVQLRLLGCFNHWLDRRGLDSGDVGPSTIERYLRGRAQSGKLRKGDSLHCSGCWLSCGPTVRAWQHHLQRLSKSRWGGSSSTCDRNVACPRPR